jgi:hypothetical protein
MIEQASCSSLPITIRRGAKSFRIKSMARAAIDRRVHGRILDLIEKMAGIVTGRETLRFEQANRWFRS